MAARAWAWQAARKTLKEWMLRFILRWLAIVVALFLAAHLPFLGVTYQSWPILFLAGFILAVLTVYVRPLLLFFTLPLVIVSLGLFIWVINACLLYFVSYLMGAGFMVPNFFSALGAALLVSLVSCFFPDGKKRRQVQFRVYRAGGGSGAPRRDDTDHRQPPPGKGPVIDI